MGGVNLQWTLRTQKLLHQWVMTHTGNAAQWKTFQFSSLQWNHRDAEEKKEFQVDGIWYDTKEISWDNNQVRVLAKADKWENIFKDLIPCLPEHSSNKNLLDLSTLGWKYLPTHVFSFLIIHPLTIEMIPFPSTVCHIKSTFLESIFKPPICN
jgi:hypothetical protein